MTVRRILTVVFSLCVIATVVITAQWAQRSPLFTLKEINWVDYPSQAPFEKEVILGLVDAPINSVNLFDLDLEPLKKRVLTHPWVKNITISKIFPYSLGISVEFREPVALFQNSDGELSYIDKEGFIFGPFEPKRLSNLPTLVGFDETDAILLQGGIKLLEDWKSSKYRHLGLIASISHDKEKGFRSILRYGKHGRAVLELGHDLQAIDTREMEHLAATITYLENKNIDAYQIFVGNGKKIVVRTHPGS
ncbi:MAG: FtsQ-type POTRA domain-containing protein [Xanthomonadaceae bacterium]|nr:FtsQ-type POTRA domain-containing protein [Xanthomonadaceae bacterium]